MPEPLFKRIVRAPAPFDARAGERALDAVAAAADVPQEAEALLKGALGSAPYLARLARRFPAETARMLASAPEDSLAAELAAIAQAADAPSADQLDAALRRAKARIHLLTALADLGGAWELEQVTGALTQAADAALAASIGAHARLLGASGTSVPGYFLIALGKQGAGELNYSSDIDIAAFYDAALVDGSFAVKLTRRIVASLSRQTQDGYVFRVDLRLRPDPLSTPVALSTDAALRYYESTAQTWERAAWIKARVAAGDDAAGREFLDAFQPFVWRRSMDYGAIGEFAAIMRQISDEDAAGAVTAPGLDVKRCAGGIRHIEFFAQVQQLLWGGRDETLRSRETLKALTALTNAGHVDAQERAVLDAAYRHLRDIEHRIQMLADQATQEIPRAADDRARLAHLAYRPSAAAFDADALQTIAAARAICGRLFADVPHAETPLLFEGPEPVPGTLRHLRELGFEDADAAWAILHSWVGGQPRALRSERARVLARRLAPRILREVGATSAPGSTLTRFDEFIRALPAGVQILSMLEREPTLLADLADTLALSPRLARDLAARPDALEAFVAFDRTELAPDVLEQRIGGEIGGARDLEGALDRARRLTRETMFLIAMAVLRGDEDAAHASEFYVSLAGALIRALLPPVEADVRRNYGAIEGEFAVIAFGSFGASEMTYRSDTDIVMVYDAPEGVQSTGERPLHAETYFGRLAQRFVSALSAPTAEGLLFHIDLKLRPFGGAGPVASAFSAYEHYYRSQAWTWELMALTRARVVAGSPALGGRIGALIRDVLIQARDPGATARDVADMRARLAREKPPSGFWDLVQSPGALTDVRFTVQYLQLVHAAATPSVLVPHTREAIARLRGVGVLSDEDAAALDASAEIHLDLAQLFALAAEGPFDPETAPPRLQTRLARACAAADLDQLRAHLTLVRQRAHGVFERRVQQAATESLLPAVQMAQGRDEE